MNATNREFQSAAKDDHFGMYNSSVDSGQCKAHFWGWALQGVAHNVEEREGRDEKNNT